MDKSSKIVIIGAGVFGLTTAYQLATEGYRNITILDRNVPPVADGSSVDISRVVRVDYADDVYLSLALDAYKRWKQPRFKGIFYPSSYVLATRTGPLGRPWIEKTMAAMRRRELPLTTLDSAQDAKRMCPSLSGELAKPGFWGYYNENAGWVDASKAITQLRDDCVQIGVTFVSGAGGTVVGFDTDSSKVIKSVRTLAGSTVEGDHFILAAGAWGSSLVNMYNSTISTAQVVGYLPLTDSEMERYKTIPIYANFSTGWFNFPPHEDTKTLKMAVHGWGYTRKPGQEEVKIITADSSTPPLRPYRQRPNFVPSDGEARLREGLREILPELADRPFEKVSMCWYTDTPTGDFIMDFHPDYKNLFIAGGGSGHAFKFLPVLGEYTALAFHRRLSPLLAKKWSFRTEYQHDSKVFEGDGSRGGPERRELAAQERAKL